MFDTNEVLEKYSKDYELKKGLLFKMIDDYDLKPVQVMNGKLKTFKFDAEEVKKIGEILHLRKVDNRRIHSIQMMLGVLKQDINSPDNSCQQSINNSENDFIEAEYEEEKEIELENKLQVFKDKFADKFNLMLQEIKNESFRYGLQVGELTAELKREKEDKQKLLIESEQEINSLREQFINNFGEAEQKIKDLESKIQEAEKAKLDLKVEKEAKEKLNLDLLKEKSEKMKLQNDLNLEKSKSIWNRILGK